MGMAIIGGFFSVIVIWFLAAGINSMSGIEVIMFILVAALPGMLIGGIWSIKKTQNELKDELSALRGELAQAKEKKEETK